MRSPLEASRKSCSIPVGLPVLSGLSLFQPVVTTMLQRQVPSACIRGFDRTFIHENTCLNSIQPTLPGTIWSADWILTEGDK